MTKILVIEDEAQIRNDVMDWLRFENYEVYGAENGLIGLEIATREAPGLILCDINMPKMNGYDVLLEIRSNPILTATPFIFLTAASGHDDIRQGMELGADDYVTKPFTYQDVMHAVRTRLEKQETLQRLFQARIEYMDRLVEEEREKQQIKSQVTAMFVHDFRNPLAAMMSIVNTIRDYEARLDPDRKRAKLDQVMTLGKRLVRMMDEMLMISEMENGTLQYLPRSVDIVQLTSDIVEEFRIIDANKHTIVCTITVTGEYILDENLFRHIASNLISNALKYSPEKSEVAISLDRPTDSLEFSVLDHGIGIPESEIEYLFAPFSGPQM